MNLKQKLMSGGVLAALAVSVAGCGGIQGSHGVSPASFLLPGLIYNEPAKPNIESQAEAESVVQNDFEKRPSGSI